MKLEDKKVAIVHDWLYGGGAEKVVLELHKMFPDAPIYTSYCTDEWRKRLDNKVITGYLQRWPFSRLRKFLPVLRQRWFRKLNLSGFDLIISSSGNGEAKFVTKPADTTHICYCHTPTHFYWRHYENYLQNPGFGVFNPLARLGLKLLVKPLRKKDYGAAQKVDHFIANSSHIAKDIKTFYGRESSVVFPPVDVERFTAEATERSGFVTLGRLVPNKRVDIIITACNELGVDLKVIGRGPELKNLQKLAGPTITFITNASDSEVSQQLASAEGFIFAAFEDFGIAPVEALASGTPIIAYHAGGALDYVVEGQTGQFFKEQTVESLTTALKSFSLTKYNSRDIKQAAQKFSKENFHKNLRTYIASVLQ